MSVLDFIWNAGQDGKIATLEEEIETLTKRVEILEDWIRYYGKCEEGKPNTTSPMVETSKRLEESVLEERTKCSEERDQK